MRGIVACESGRALGLVLVLQLLRRLVPHLRAGSSLKGRPLRTNAESCAAPYLWAATNKGFCSQTGSTRDQPQYATWCTDVKRQPPGRVCRVWRVIAVSVTRFSCSAAMVRRP